jgi:hypothetical protein
MESVKAFIHQPQRTIGSCYHNAPQEVTGESLGDEWKGYIGRPYITHNAPQEVTGDSLSDEWKA